MCRLCGDTLFTSAVGLTEHHTICKILSRIGMVAPSLKNRLEVINLDDDNQPLEINL
jgi:hypothetical protein